MLALAYVAGLVALILAIAIADSTAGAGIALTWILAVLLYARHDLRCPLCGASVLNAPVGRGLSWLAGSNRRCARCMTSYDAAVSAGTGGRTRSPGGSKEKTS